VAAGLTMHNLIVKYPVTMLVLIWATLLLAMWIIPGNPQPEVSVAERSAPGRVPPGLASVRRLIAIRHRTLAD
jgi:hypothetical protein